MIAAWMASAILVGICATFAAFSFERVTTHFARPARYVWLAALVATAAWPVALFVLSRGTPVAFVRTGAISVQSATDVVAQVTRGAIPFPLDAMLIVVWVTLTLGCAGRLAWGAGALAARRPWWEPRWVDGTRVWASNATGPAVVGLRPMYIVLPKWAFELDESSQTLVVEHEAEHVRARDPYLLWCAAIAATLMPWNPALWIQLRRLRLAIELDCDARVLRRNPDPDRYASLLLTMAQRNVARSALMSPAFLEPQTNLERRITAMTEPQRTSSMRLATLVAIGASSIAVACSVRAPATQPAAPAPTSASARGATIVAAPRADSGRSVHYEFQVERPATQQPGTGVPVYPATLKAAGVEGRVLASFVVDTSGRVELGSFKVVESTDEQFTAAVRDALPATRFLPALVNGRAVKQLVQMPYKFSVK